MELAANFGSQGEEDYRHSMFDTEKENQRVGSGKESPMTKLCRQRCHKARSNPKKPKLTK
jgi:hypothetical protein